MLVSEVMCNATNRVHSNTPLLAAVRKMLVHHLQDLMVVDDSDELVGTLSERNLSCRAELGPQHRARRWNGKWFPRTSAAADYAHRHGLYVRDVMVENFVRASPHMRLADAVQQMNRHNLSCLPVVIDGQLVGVLRYVDLLWPLEHVLARARLELQRPDHLIRADILTTLAKEDWVPKHGIEVTVSQGEVTLAGIMFNSDERKGIIAIADTTPGVKKVHDKSILSYQSE
jgi:CBS domain-containing protein